MNFRLKQVSIKEIFSVDYCNKDLSFRIVKIRSMWQGCNKLFPEIELCWANRMICCQDNRNCLILTSTEGWWNTFSNKISHHNKLKEDYKIKMNQASTIKWETSSVLFRQWFQEWLLLQLLTRLSVQLFRTWVIQGSISSMWVQERKPPFKRLSLKFTGQIYSEEMI